MEELKKLYPMKFCALQDEYSWGSEEFKLADLGYRDSLVRDGWLAGNSLGELMDTYLDRVTGDRLYQYYGRQFPVCVRVLKVKGDMPLQVHPGDEIASQRYDFLGKDKFWYVLRAGKDARIGAGFLRDSDAGEFWTALGEGKQDALLNFIAPHAGLGLFIPAGTPHTASGDIEILEIAESSPLDFCLSGRGGTVSEDQFDPSLTLVDALDFIDYGKFKPSSGKGDTLIDIPAFTVTRMALKDPVRCNNAEFDSIILYSCASGAASVQLQVLGQTADFPLRAGETILVPAECGDFNLVPVEDGTVLLETTVSRVEKDSYLEPTTTK